MKCDECKRDNENRLLHWEYCSQYIDRVECRRYALLQAAAVLYSNRHRDNSYANTIHDAVGTAQDLLAEIEKREKEKNA